MSLVKLHSDDGGEGGGGCGFGGPGGGLLQTEAAQPAVAAQTSQQRDWSIA